MKTIASALIAIGAIVSGHAAWSWRRYGPFTENHEDGGNAARLVGGAFLIFIGLVIFVGDAFARNLGQWENSDPAIKLWYSQLLQPDTIGMGTGISCCGESDAYYVDVSVSKDQIIATIDDDRDDDKLRRQHEINGTHYVVPPNKIVGDKQKVGNPVGRAIIFLAGPQIGMTNDRLKPRAVLCFVDNASS